MVEAHGVELRAATLSALFEFLALAPSLVWVAMRGPNPNVSIYIYTQNILHIYI